MKRKLLNSAVLYQVMKNINLRLILQFIKIITCDEQLHELSEVFKKPKIKKYFSKDQIIEFFELLDESSEIFLIRTKTNLCRDPKDDYLA